VAFCTLARAEGYTVLVSPHPNLVSVPGGPHTPRGGETREAAYLRSRIVEISAANADIVETQAQTLQRDPAAYRGLVHATARVAHEVNHGVEVISGLSTHPGYPPRSRCSWTPGGRFGTSSTVISCRSLAAG